MNDEATQKLMTEFYRAWIKLGNKRKAFEAAQLAVRKEFSNPYFWAAFVMIGN